VRAATSAAPPIATIPNVATTIGSCSGSDSSVSRPKMVFNRVSDIMVLLT